MSEFLTEQEVAAVVISLKVATLGIAIGLAPAMAISYWLARWSGRGRWLVETVINLPLVLPPVVTGYLLLLLLGRSGPVGQWLDQVFGIQLTFSWTGGALVAGIVAFPLMVRSMRLSFSEVERRLELAAMTLGASRTRVFFTITLPLAYRGVIAATILGFARSLGEFGATIMFVGNIQGKTQTIPLAIYSLVQQPSGVGQSWRLVVIAVVLACVTLAVSEWFEQRGRARRAL